MQLPLKLWNTKEAADLYNPRVINDSVMLTTYNVALIEEKIVEKHKCFK